MKSKLIKAAAIVAALVALTGCKPTEGNYRKAYQAAREKRAVVEAENMLPATGLQSTDGPQMRIIDGDTLFVDRVVLRYEDSTEPRQPWLLTVGIYKMNTNAKANAETLRESGWGDATFLKAKGGKWYTIAATASTLDSLKVLCTRFEEEHKDYPYVGLPGRPVLVNIR